MFFVIVLSLLCQSYWHANEHRIPLCILTHGRHERTLIYSSSNGQLLAYADVQYMTVLNTNCTYACI